MREKILKVIERVLSGEIKPEDGAALIEAVCQNAEDKMVEDRERILVVEITGDESLKVRIPLKILKVANEFIPIALSLSGSRLDENTLKSMRSALDKIGEGLENMEGDVVSVEDGKDRIRIYLE